MSIRKATVADARTVKEITETTIREVYPHYYAKGAVDFFLTHHQEAHICEDIQKGIVYLCFDASHAAVGTVTLRSNEICRLFVLPRYQGHGYGREMLSFAEKIIFETYETVVLDASLPAKCIYQKRGYFITDSQVIRTENGDFLCYDVMVKQRG